jgi:hypothetical protein
MRQQVIATCIEHGHALPSRAADHEQWQEHRHRIRFEQAAAFDQRVEILIEREDDDVRCATRDACDHLIVRHDIVDLDV